MESVLSVKIRNVKNIKELAIELPLKPDLYAITGINGIGKSTLLSCISPRLKRPISFSFLDREAADGGEIEYQIDNEIEVWRVHHGKWGCQNIKDLSIRGFQEGSLTNGTRFSNISFQKFNYYKRLLKVNPSLIIPADDFVKENLGSILRNDKRYYQGLYRLDKKRAERYYQYKGVVYYLKIENEFIPQFKLSAGEFLLINLLHLFYNLFVRENNRAKLNLIFIDEIELALHPSAIRRLVELSKKIAFKYNVAIYFSTHSVEIINALPVKNLFYLKMVKQGVIKCDTPCYPAYITRDIYMHIGYDILILVEDDLAKNLVENYIIQSAIADDKRIAVIPVGGYDNTLELHNNLLQEKILYPISHIISIVDGDVETTVENKYEKGHWDQVSREAILFLPIDSLEKYIKKELFDNKNYDFMRALRDKLFKFESEPNWYEEEYRENIENKRQQDIKKGGTAKDDEQYFVNGKNLFSILWAKYREYQDDERLFRDELIRIVLSHMDFEEFSEQLSRSLGIILKQ